MDARTLIISAPAILFGLSFHEFMHAYVAYKLGDPTAKFAGRLTLNPLKHLDLIGTIALFFFRIGWAKPVPINPYNFSDMKKGVILTSLAGPAANFFLAMVFGILYRLINPTSLFLKLFLTSFVIYNLILAFFNLLPIPPLDGSKIFMYILPYKYRERYMEIESYGFYILIGLIFLGSLIGIPILWRIISPFINFFYQIFTGTMI
ncbi:MAG: site-2 protease family protein [candidate division WOR-3 bacterium]